MARPIHEIKCKLVSLTRIAQFPVAALLAYYAKNSDIARMRNIHDPGEALAAVLDEINRQNKLKNVKTLLCQQNKGRIYIAGTNNVQRSITIECLDLTLLTDLSRNISTFPSCKDVHRLYLVCISCNVSNNRNNIVCCSICKLCQNCSKTRDCSTTNQLVRDTIDVIHDMRNMSAHITDEECLQYEKATCSGIPPKTNFWKQIENFSNSIKTLLRILAELGISIKDDCAFMVDLVLKTKSVTYWDIINGFSQNNTKAIYFEEKLEINLQCSAINDNMSTMKNIHSDFSRAVTANFEFWAKELLKGQLNLSTNENRFEVVSQGMKYLPNTQSDTLSATIILHISSIEETVPECYKQMYSDESINFQKEIISIFNELISKKMSNVSTICTGWIYSSIHIDVTFFTKQELKWSQEMSKEIYSIIQNEMEEKFSLLKQVLKRHKLQKCNITVSYINPLTENSITLQAILKVLDSSLVEKIQIFLPMLKQQLEDSSNQKAILDVHNTQTFSCWTTQDSSTAPGKYLCPPDVVKGNLQPLPSAAEGTRASDHLIEAHNDVDASRFNSRKAYPPYNYITEAHDFNEEKGAGKENLLEDQDSSIKSQVNIGKPLGKKEM